MLNQIQLKLSRGFIILAVLTVSVGCASYGPSSPQPISSSADDIETLASSNINIGSEAFLTENDKVNIYIYRNGSASAHKMPVSLDGRLIGSTAPKTFLKLTVEPGPHEIASEEGDFSSVTIATQAGKNYFVLQEILSGSIATGANLQEVSELEGQMGVQECELISSMLDSDTFIN